MQRNENVLIYEKTIIVGKAVNNDGVELGNIESTLRVRQFFGEATTTAGKPLISWVGLSFVTNIYDKGNMSVIVGGGGDAMFKWLLAEDLTTIGIHAKKCDTPRLLKLRDLATEYHLNDLKYVNQEEIRVRDISDDELVGVTIAFENLIGEVI